MDYSKEELDLSIVVNKYSPTNSEYPTIALSNGINNQIIRAKEKITPIIYQALTDANFIKDSKTRTDDVRYVVDMSKSIKEQLKANAVSLVEENGNLYAQLREKGKYSTKLPIKKELISSTGLTSSQVMNSLQFSAIRNQLKNIKNELAAISESVKYIYIGQQNDRIAQYFSGIHLYIEALNISDLNFKKYLYAQSLKSFSDGICQLTLEMEENIIRLKNKEFKKSLLKSGAKLLEFINIINQSYTFIHQSYLMKATIYSECGETKALVKCLTEYSSFLENTIVKNMKVLKEYDINDNGTEHGLWSNRSNLIDGIKDISNSLENGTEVIILLDGAAND